MKQSINVIATEVSTGTVLTIDSFLVESQDQAEEPTALAEAKFTEKCESAGINPDEIDDAINDGYIEIEDEDGNIMLSIVWSGLQ